MDEALSELFFDVGLQVGHFVVVVHPVDDEVGVPGGHALDLEEVVEELQRLLPEVVSEELETHQIRVVREGLSEERQAEVVYLVVGHVHVQQRLVLRDRLRNGLRTVV